jgi:hypothetical protein
LTIQDRRVALLAILNDVPTTQLGAIDNSSREWLTRFPGGISPLPRLNETQAFQVNASHIVATSGHLSDESFVAFCEAVRTWQRRSAFDFLIGLAPDLIVAKFLQDFPQEAAMLRAGAANTDLPLRTYLGADRPKEKSREKH